MALKCDGFFMEYSLTNAWTLLIDRVGKAMLRIDRYLLFPGCATEGVRG